MSPWLTNTVSIPDTVPSHDTARPTTSAALKRHVKLRESLAGAYKVVDERNFEEATASRSFAGVDYVDLT